MKLFSIVKHDLKLILLKAKYRKKNVKINSAFINSNTVLLEGANIGDEVVIYENVKLGRYSYVMPYTTIMNTEVGDFCSIGSNCHIAPWEHPIHHITTSPKVYRDIIKCPNVYSDDTKKVYIGNDVWIGDCAIICGGITIGDGAVIGANAVVTKNVPDFAVVVGAPAVIKKYRFTKEKIVYLKKVAWWNWSITKIIENKELFCKEKIDLNVD